MQNLKILITTYLTTAINKKKIVYSMKFEPWFKVLNSEFKKMQLPEEWSTMRKLWHYLKGTSSIPLCPITGKERKWRAGAATEQIELPGMSYGYSRFADRAASDKGNIEIRKQSLSNKYGSDITNAMYIPGVDETRKNIFLKKYGVEYHTTLDSVKEKIKKTMLFKYGVEHNFIGWQDKIFQKYGVYNPAHIPNVAEKTAFNRFKNRKPYILETGEIINLQGYEPFGFNYLKTKYIESQIKYKKSDMPVIYYNYGLKTRRYYPDFFIPDANLIVEIKSKYTLKVDFDIITQKARAVDTIGYNFLLLVFAQNGGQIASMAAIDFRSIE